MNAVERKPVETRVLNPTASEASYKPKQRSFRTTNLKKKVLAPNSPGAEMSGAELSSAETAAPNRRCRNVPDPWGTPRSIEQDSEDFPFKDTHCCLSDK